MRNIQNVKDVDNYCYPIILCSTQTGVLVLECCLAAHRFQKHTYIFETSH